MKVVFMGTPEFAVPTLQALIDHHQVIGVVTQPDKQRGRGKKVQFPPVKEKAVEYDLPVYQPVKTREEEFVSVLRDLNPDVIVVVAYGQILPESILNIPKYGCINVHGSLLPKYRGAAPIQWSVLDGEEKTGITTMYMEKGLDTGDMIDKVELTLDPKETAGSLHDKLMVMGADLLLETLEKLENGTAVRTKQDDSLSCYAKMLTKDMGQVDFSKSAVEIERLIRGLNPWPSAYTSMDGKTMKLWDADVTPYDGDAEPGTIVDVTKEAIVAATGEGALALKEIQLAGKKRMKVSAFLLGYHVETGTKLGE
ncbi:methionyl-tRNA formyltransferase [Anaerostipes faecalis]|uniref:methionyl-tRNA formyltransferase n=1 Tax=Anaerostipes faecalis TaxID=2738446 RepID=UPI001C1DEAEE|nr:methionyl-tRNA formyltransferase [Anaerostipes faecalis]